MRMAFEICGLGDRNFLPRQSLIDGNRKITAQLRRKTAVALISGRPQMRAPKQPGEGEACCPGAGRLKSPKAGLRIPKSEQDFTLLRELASRSPSGKPTVA